jgi:hypothetical protein
MQKAALRRESGVFIPGGNSQGQTRAGVRRMRFLLWLNLTIIDRL